MTRLCLKIGKSMAQMRWDRAKKPLETRNIVEENEWRMGDAAARWIASKEAREAEKKSPARKAQVRREDARQGPIDARKTVTIYTDGACDPNPGKGGWAFVVYTEGREAHSSCGGNLNTTNNAMEMKGVIMALRWAIKRGIRVTVISDSQYVVKGCNKWRFGWKAKGWRRNAGGKTEPVKNAELWKEIDDLLHRSKATIEWCKGHSGIAGNERADELSNAGRSMAR